MAGRAFVHIALDIALVAMRGELTRSHRLALAIAGLAEEDASRRGAVLDFIDLSGADPHGAGAQLRDQALGWFAPEAPSPTARYAWQDRADLQ